MDINEKEVLRFLFEKRMFELKKIGIKINLSFDKYIAEK